MNANHTMQAAVYEQYGPPEVLHLRQIAKPLPKPNEVLIKIHATTVTSGDWRMRQADPYIVRLFAGLFKPHNPILGHELAGEIEAIGAEVTNFKVGDAVFASTKLQSGTYAEYICMDEGAALAIIPANTSYPEAAAVPVGGLTVLHFLREAHITWGQAVLVYGASGSLGTYAVQLAKYYGATVTAVCSTSNMAMVQALGADEVLDYTQTDFTQIGQRFDVVMDAVGLTTYRQCQQLIYPKGSYINVGWGFGLMMYKLLNALMGKPRIIIGMSKDNAADLRFLAQMLTDGHLKAAIDRHYSLAEMVEAHRYVQAGHKKGNVVIDVR